MKIRLMMPAAQFSALELLVALPPETLGFHAGDHRPAARMRAIADAGWAHARDGQVRADLPLADVQFAINCAARAARAVPLNRDSLARTLHSRLADVLERLEEAVFSSPALAA
ncbi:hypothetical protein ABEG18_12705 [Alsobacter sp. KACC 23698]|uniref:Uncharacterized protein n=1 Tax=Alsobacter sp. KACC 23698 TaxID=3149229 RepID=A0AAU7JNQ6_9HYPH